ncbi:hypothetical protein [Aureimonas sp. AU12]|uniref:hypothetical protein n=1 Tax=Aureimonas sp. AU12 TaxID=1638161 RepID=UPI000ADA1AB2|nr:hypothetical protein [Aureimonas sp. AU12]
MSRNASPAILAVIAPSATFRQTPRRDERTAPARGILLGLGICSVFWAALASVVLF